MFSKPSVKTASLLILLICLLFSLVATSAAQTTPTAAPEPDTRVVSTGEYVVLRSDDWVRAMFYKNAHTAKRGISSCSRNPVKVTHTEPI